MRGSMRERQPGIWELRVDCGRDPLTGRRRQISRSVRGTKRAAEKVLNQLTSDAENGKHSGTDATFADVVERWLALASADLSPTTVRGYRVFLDRHILPALGDQRAHKIRPTDLDDFYQALLKRENLAPATVRQAHAIIRRALGQAVRWGWIATNPASNTTPPKVTKPDITPPSVDEVRRLFDAAAGFSEEFASLLHVAVTTGARRGEVCALKWDRIDLETRALVISHAIIGVKGGLVEKDTKTHAIRRIALDEQTVEVLTDHRAAMEARASTCGTSISSASYVFSDDPAGEEPWAPDHVTHLFEKARASANLDHVRLHDLRHFNATELLAAGVPVRTVSGRLGHANAATTLGVYAHFVEASDQAAAGIMGSVMRR